MANNPRHGDPIIEAKKQPLGGEKLVASAQFQAFLDDLGDIDTETVLDLTQLVFVAMGQNESLSSEVMRLNKIIESNSQEFAVLQAVIMNIQANTLIINDKLENLEQLINVD